MAKKITDMEKIRNSDSLLLKRAKELVLLHKLGSVQMLQRHFGIGYLRAKRILEKLKKDNEVQDALGLVVDV